MDAFGYLSVLLSIILGLGIAQILTALGRLIRQRDRVSGYWPVWLWAGNLLLIHVQMWWSMFELRGRSEWTFLEFGMVLMQPVVLYMASAVVLPADDREDFDLRAHYWRQVPWLFGFLIAVVGVSLLKDWVLDGRLPETANFAFHGWFMATCALVIAVRNPRLHAVHAGLASFALLSYIALLFSHLD